MDFNGDGHRDVLSGCFPGEIHVFMGKEDGTFEAATQVKDQNGDTLRFKASVPYAVDWDRDGDMDLIVGDISGHVHFVENLSGDKTHKFKNTGKVKVGDQEIRVGGGDSGPVVADWDGDGVRDLLIGCGDGAVLFYRNTTKEGMPTLSTPETLLPAARPTPGETTDKANSPCGTRVKVAVADWNGDKKLDLLVGDFSSRMRPAPELTPEQIKKRDELQAAQQTLMPKLMAASQRVMREVKKGVGLPEDHKGPIPADKQEAVQKAMMAAYENDEEMKSLQAEIREIAEALQPMMPGYEPEGHVWVLLRG